MTVVRSSGYVVLYVWSVRRSVSPLPYLYRALVPVGGAPVVAAVVWQGVGDGDGGLLAADEEGGELRHSRQNSFDERK